jgi:hypothetical protein
MVRGTLTAVFMVGLHTSKYPDGDDTLISYFGSGKDVGFLLR